MSDRRYRLERDDDAHWYVVPVDQHEAFQAWVYGGGAEEGEGAPEGVEPVGGWQGIVTFTDPDFSG